MTIGDYAENVTQTILNEAADEEEAVRMVYDSGNRMKGDYSLAEIRTFYDELLGALELRRIGLEANAGSGPEFTAQIDKVESAEEAARERLKSIQEELSNT